MPRNKDQGPRTSTFMKIVGWPRIVKMVEIESTVWENKSRFLKKPDDPAAFKAARTSGELDRHRTHIIPVKQTPNIHL